MRNEKLIGQYHLWLEAQGTPLENDEGYTEKQEKESELVTEILALESSIYVLRRTTKPYIDGSTIDALRDLCTRAIDRYEEVMGKEYYDANKDVDF